MSSKIQTPSLLFCFSCLFLLPFILFIYFPVQFTESIIYTNILHHFEHVHVSFDSESYESRVAPVFFFFNYWRRVSTLLVCTTLPITKLTGLHFLVYSTLCLLLFLSILFEFLLFLLIGRRRLYLSLSR